MAQDPAPDQALETLGPAIPAQAPERWDPESRAPGPGLAETGRVLVAAEESWTAPKVWPQTEGVSRLSPAALKE